MQKYRDQWREKDRAARSARRRREHYRLVATCMFRLAERAICQCGGLTWVTTAGSTVSVASGESGWSISAKETGLPPNEEASRLLDRYYEIVDAI